MGERKKVEIFLAHRVDVTTAIHYLRDKLECDEWYALCQHEPRLIIQLIRSKTPAYDVCFECTHPTDKAIYHGSMASSLAIIPISSEHNLPTETVKDIKADLAELALHHSVLPS